MPKKAIAIAVSILLLMSKSSQSESKLLSRILLAFDGGKEGSIALHGTADESVIKFDNLTDSNGVGVTAYRKLYPQAYE